MEAEVLSTNAKSSSSVAGWATWAVGAIGAKFYKSNPVPKRKAIHLIHLYSTKNIYLSAQPTNSTAPSESTVPNNATQTTSSSNESSLRSPPSSKMESMSLDTDDNIDGWDADGDDNDDWGSLEEANEPAEDTKEKEETKLKNVDVNSDVGFKHYCILIICLKFFFALRISLKICWTQSHQ